MAAEDESQKKSKQINKYEKFIGSVEYRNDLPGSLPGVKFLPNDAKSLMDYTTDPVSFPEEETQYDFHLKGLYQVLDLDLLAHNPYDGPNQQGEMDGKDAALLIDVEDPPMPTPQPITVPPSKAPKPVKPTIRQPSVQPFSVLQCYQEERQELSEEAVSEEQQKMIINETFVDINKPLFVHPTNANSKARPVAVIPVFPDHQHAHQFVHVKFGILPHIKGKCLLKDCGNYLINFKEIPNQPPEALENGITGYITDQRFKEDHNAEAERYEKVVLNERNGHIYYQMISSQLRLRKERPTADTRHSLCLLQMKSQKPKTD